MNQLDEAARRSDSFMIRLPNTANIGSAGSSHNPLLQRHGTLTLRQLGQEEDWVTI